MSFDLAVWHSDRPLSAEEALELYIGLCDETASLPGESRELSDFYVELTARYPELDDVPDDDLDRSPFNCRLDRSGMHVIMPIAWSRCEEVSREVFDLAEKHGLMVFDPQSSWLYNLKESRKPIKPVPRSWWKSLLGQK